MFVREGLGGAGLFVLRRGAAGAEPRDVGGWKAVFWLIHVGL